ncbi:transposase PF05598 domain protein [Leptospira kirschneri serovar Sokoine str. RM1]|nr:transposase PF05598 domain protein [Leptospira kirschneri serovar Sokoine str. RM1]
MAKFKNTDPNQLRMHVLDFQELFGEGHPIHGFKKVMERLDFEDFDKNYQNDATGRPAISPKKVISALFYSILIGNLSMRELCRLSKLRAELIYLLDGEELDHTFISKFRKVHSRIYFPRQYFLDMKAALSTLKRFRLMEQRSKQTRIRTILET